MDLGFSDDDLAFRAEVRAFIADNLPAGIRRKMAGGLHLEREDYIAWQKVLFDKGWIAPGWPVEVGGTGWTPTQRYIFEEELGAANAPWIIPFGLGMVGPVIYTFGSEAQKERFLPPILASDEWWCQGYSEPGSGSDLASLRTRAVADGDDYVVNGHKFWTTMAHWADWMFCLVRTDAEVKPQEGISFLLIDMRSPGVTVRPIITMDLGHTVNEVFLEDVRVPKANLVGEEGRGWTYAKFLLGHERTGIAEVGRSKQQIDRLRAIATAERTAGGPLIDERRFRDKIAEVEIELMALEYTQLRSLADAEAGRAPGPESSILKIKGSEVRQAISELAVEALGYYGAPYEPEALVEGWNEEPIGPAYAASVMPGYLHDRAASIYGGTNEIQKNIIAKMVLGL
jgi:alkylation response protein AidB-like acyl-CoA dehydrogenase